MGWAKMLKIMLIVLYAYLLVCFVVVIDYIYVISDISNMKFIVENFNMVSEQALSLPSADL